VSQGEARSEFNNRFSKVSSNPFGVALKLLAFRHVVSHLVPHRPFMPRLGLILHWTGAENGLHWRRHIRARWGVGPCPL